MAQAHVARHQGDLPALKPMRGLREGLGIAFPSQSTHPRMIRGSIMCPHSQTMEGTPIYSTQNYSFF